MSITETKKTLIMGHRGHPSKYPENTILSFRKALDYGVDIMEFDINLSRDKIPMVIHDSKLERTTNGTGLVSDFTYRELKEFDAGVKKGETYSGEKIPSLDEALNLFEKYPEVLLNIEIKGNSKEAAGITVDVLEKRGFTTRSYFTCFDAEILHYIKNINPELKVQGFPRHMMSNFREGKNGTYQIMDYVGIGLRDFTEEMLKFFHGMNIITGVWCVDDKETALKMIDCGVDIITSNSPDVIISALKERRRK